MQALERREAIARIERLAYRAWPAAEVQECDGWRLRFTHGVTHRANSVWPNGAGDALSLGEKIAAAQEFYTARNLPAIFQLCPAAEPARLDAVLEGRGYTRGRETAVQIASVVGVLATLEAGVFPVTVGSALDDPWLALYRETEGVEREDALQRAGIMRRIEPAVAYATAWSGRTPCAVGSAVCEDGWVGLFNLATSVPYRRQGAARAVLRAVLEWGRERGGSNVYLQVMHENTPALALYRQLGFSTLYGYHYRTGPAHNVR